METYVKIAYTWKSMNQNSYVGIRSNIKKYDISKKRKESDKRKYFWRKR